MSLPAAADPVLDLAQIRASDGDRVGPKVARLGQLASAGWRVPDGYAITAQALASWLSQDAAAPAPPWLADAVAAAHERLERRTGAGPALQVAVRSSAVHEDGDQASFAGQYATYLGVSGTASVLDHVRRCWASGFTAHALAYRSRAHGGLAGGETGTLDSHDLAVGVLELVDARTAGVVFTVDPVSGRRDRLVVEANWGFGESVVSGHVTPDQWIVDRASGEVLTATVGAKHVWSAFNPAGGRVELEPLPAALAAQPCLQEEEVRHLCELAARIEEAEGGVPQDVEWAIARDRPFPDSVYILQHRPETTAQPPEPAASEQAKAYDPVQYALRNVFKVPGA